MSGASFALSACAEMLYPDRPFLERVERIHARGFGVELWSFHDKDLAALAATGARFSSMTGYLHGDLVDPDGADEVVRTAAQAVAAAQELGVPRLVVHPAELVDGRAARPRFRSGGAMWASALRGLERLGALGERSGVVFCLENLNTVLDHPGVPLARAKDTLALVEGAGHPHVRMMLDLYHAQLGEGDLTALVRRAGDAIGEIQVADVPGRCEPGTGEIQYARIARELEALDLYPPVGLEAYAEGDTDLALDRFRAAFTL